MSFGLESVLGYNNMYKKIYNHTSCTRLILSVALASLLVGCSQPPDRAAPVGRQYRDYVDTERYAWGSDAPRPVVTTIWYPAAAGTEEQAWRLGVFRPGWSAVDAELSPERQRRPLVLLSHGTGGAAMQLSWLAETLAANGYIVAAVNHHGNTAAEPTYQPQGFVIWWDRAKDLSLVLEHLLNDAQFGPHIDQARIGAAGFSLGGYTVLALAGATLSRQQRQAYCQTAETAASCALPPEAAFTEADIAQLLATDARFSAANAGFDGRYLDARVRAFYALAPVMGESMTASSLAAIALPVRVVVGAADRQALPAISPKPIANAISGATYWELDDVSHYTFLSPCTWLGQFTLRQLCAEPTGVDRVAIHRRVAADALAFFEGSL